MADLFENMFEERTCMPIETLMIETNEWHSHLIKTYLFLHFERFNVRFYLHKKLLSHMYQKNDIKPKTEHKYSLF